MKFLVISKPLSTSSGTPLDPIPAQAAKNRLTEFIKSGLIERAFAIQGGGSAFIVNAPSQGILSKIIRNHPLSLHSEIEVLPLRDFEAPEPTSP